MNEEQIKKTIFDILGRIAPEADFDELSPDDNIQKTLDIDSFDFLNFIIGLNDELGVDIPESDYGQLATPAKIISYISAHVE